MTDLHQYAEDRGIRVDYRMMVTATSLSVHLGDSCAICIDPTKLHGDEAEKLAHEIGHCETLSFYSPSTPLETVARCEHKADVWAIKKLVPKDELMKLIADHRDKWEICDILGISADFLQKAAEYYEKV